MCRNTFFAAFLLVLSSTLSVGCNSGGGSGASAALSTPITGTYSVTAIVQSDTCNEADAGETEDLMITIEVVANEGNGNVRIAQDGVIVAVGDFSAASGVLNMSNSVEYDGRTMLLSRRPFVGTLQFSQSPELTFSGSYSETQAEDGCTRSVALIGTMQQVGPPASETLPLLVSSTISEEEAIQGNLNQLEDFFQLPCGDSGAGDVAVLFEAPEDGTYRFSTFGTETLFDSVLAAFEYQPSIPGALIECADESILPEELALDLVAGERVIVALDGEHLQNGGGGEFILSVTAD